MAEGDSGVGKAMFVAALLNAILDLVGRLYELAPEAVTPENIGGLVAKRQAEIDHLHERVNEQDSAGVG